MIMLGTKTIYGEVVAIGWVGERYYWLVDRHGSVAMIPAIVLEAGE